MSLKTIRPAVTLAIEHLQRLETGLRDIEAAIDNNDRSAVLGSLLMAQDNLMPMQTLIEASLLLAKQHPRAPMRLKHG